MSSIIYSSSNREKYVFIKFILDKLGLFNSEWYDSSHLYIKETEDSKLNAQIKAELVSKITNKIVLSSDDSLFVYNLKNDKQPNAQIYRNISPQRNTIKIIQYYIDLIENQFPNGMNAKFTSFFSFAKNGKTIYNFEYSYDVILNKPKKLNIINDMPLSSLHFVTPMNKFYYELNDKEKWNFHSHLFSKFCLAKKIISEL